jgi:hypothetical protein
LKLSTKARNKLPAKEFALSGGRYPIPDKSHARNALARASEEYAKGKLSGAQLKEIRVKAGAKLKGKS